MADGKISALLEDRVELFAVLGVIFALLLTFKSILFVVRFVNSYILGSILGLSVDIKRLGHWAVVTGCTDGIGKAYAEQLAKRGLNVALISRSAEKLDALAKELETTYGVETVVVVADFALTRYIKDHVIGPDVAICCVLCGVLRQETTYGIETVVVVADFTSPDIYDYIKDYVMGPDVTICCVMCAVASLETTYGIETVVVVADFTSPDIYDHIKDYVMGLDVGILVNNVGMSYEHPEYFLEIHHREKQIQDFFNVNMLSMSMMTSIVLPGMVEKHKGAIINVSSFAACYPVPLLSLYSATKAYVDYLSQCLNEEYRSKGITIQSVKPYFVTTKLSKLRKTSLTVPSPTRYVKSALGLLGLESSGPGYWPHAIMYCDSKTSLTVPSSTRHVKSALGPRYCPHAVMNIVANSLPTWLFNKYITSVHLALRSRALKKRRTSKDVLREQMEAAEKAKKQ